MFNPFSRNCLISPKTDRTRALFCIFICCSSISFHYPRTHRSDSCTLLAEFTLFIHSLLDLLPRNVDFFFIFSPFAKIYKIFFEDFEQSDSIYFCLKLPCQNECKLIICPSIRNPKRLLLSVIQSDGNAIYLCSFRCFVFILTFYASFYYAFSLSLFY